MDSFGKCFIISDYGGTHDPFIGGTIEGCPKGFLINFELIAIEMARRAPSGHATSTLRKEKDEVEFLSGFKDGITTGEPIRFRIKNTDVQPNLNMEKVLKPSHASYTYMIKYGITDNSGIGRASARQTACRVVAGAIAKQILSHYQISFHSEIAPETLDLMDDVSATDSFQDTIGAKVLGFIRNVPAGLGEPVYDKLNARLAYAMMSINAAKGFEIGMGYKSTQMTGSAYNDLQNPDFSFQTNHDGGIQAGISNGEEIYYSVAFKPIPTLRKSQKNIDFLGNSVTFSGNNRNDICVAPRVLPVVEAMAAIVILDFMLISKIEPKNDK